MKMKKLELYRYVTSALCKRLWTQSIHRTNPKHYIQKNNATVKSQLPRTRNTKNKATRSRVRKALQTSQSEIPSVKLTQSLKIGLLKWKQVFQPSFFRCKLLVSRRVYQNYNICIPHTKSDIDHICTWRIFAIVVGHQQRQRHHCLVSQLPDVTKM